MVAEQQCAATTNVRKWQVIGATTRCVLTFPVLFLCRRHPLLMVLALQVLDMVDCLGVKCLMQWVEKRKFSISLLPRVCQTSFWYQRSDKWLDLIAYVWAIFLLETYRYNHAPEFLWWLAIWRTIGVVLFSVFRSGAVLIPFFDAMKEVILLQEIMHWGWIPVPYHFATLLVLLVGKIAFEAKWHRKVKWTE